MKSKMLFRCSLIVLAAFCAGGMVLLARDAAITVDGVITKRDGQFVSGINVRAVRNGKTIDKTTSNKVDGGYSLRFAANGPFDLVFDEPDYQPAVLPALSGRENQIINKTMLLKSEQIDEGSRLAAEFATAYIRTVER